MRTKLRHIRFAAQRTSEEETGGHFFEELTKARMRLLSGRSETRCRSALRGTEQD